MIDEQGRAEFFNRFLVPRGTEVKLDRLAELVERSSRLQNLVSASTLPTFWHRHMLDSAQLRPLVRQEVADWLDVGSGAGFPGLVLAILSDARHMLVEPRRLRAEFLMTAVEELDLGSRVSVVQTKIENLSHGAFGVITARAFSSLTRTLDATFHLAAGQTQWLLHKGRSAAVEVDEAQSRWDGNVDLVPSITDPDASIVRLSQMRRRTDR